MAWLWYILLLLLSLAGVAITLLGLPGLWLMVGSMAIFAWITQSHQFVGKESLIALLLLGLVAEVLEFVAGAAGSKAAGGRKRGMIGAIVGTFIGGILFSFVPIPIIATIVGACLGAFIGAAIMELTDRDLMHALRVGTGAAKGRLWGIIIKLGIGLVMLIIIMIAAFPI
jgi:uncharacterized protein YqgC (DUF456 family)